MQLDQEQMVLIEQSYPTNWIGKKKILFSADTVNILSFLPLVYQ